MTIDDLIAIMPPPKIKRLAVGREFVARFEAADPPVSLYNAGVELQFSHFMLRGMAYGYLTDGSRILIDARTEAEKESDKTTYASMEATA